MRQDKKLMLGMALFFLIIFVSFGVIVANEKLAPYYIPKVDKKLNSYLKENYKDIINEVKTDKTIYEKTKYTLKVISKKNSNLYFKIDYQNKKISDTYKKDYLEGKTLLSKIKNDLEQEIYNKTKIKSKVKINSTLNNFTNQVRTKIIKEQNISNLKIYTVTTEVEVENFNTNDITKKIKTIVNKFNNKNLTPKYFYFVITDKNDITNAVQINNITYDITTDNNFDEIINTVIKKENSDILRKSNITYKYLN